MPTPPAKLLVLGIDAANPTLLLRWAEDGTLPTLRSLLARGLVGRTRSLDGFFVGATWPSFYTGVTPARHGLHYNVQLQSGTYQFRHIASGPLTKRAPFWTHLGRAGRRVAILDVPLTQIDPSVHGVQVVEWSGHDALYGFRTWPPELATSIGSRYGMPPLGPTCDAHTRSPADYCSFTEALVRGARLKADLTLDLLQQGDWDCFVQVFTETHCAGHQCWHLHDPTHPAHDPAYVAAFGDPLQRVYAAVDRAIGAVVERAGPAFIFVLAAHGMAYWYGAQFLLQEILQRLRVTHPPATPTPARHTALLAGARSIWRQLPGPLQRRLAPLRDRLVGEEGAGTGLPTIRADPRLSSCFAVNNGLAVGGIRLNLMGREPQGTLRPGSEADEFCRHLTEALLEIVDERSGGPLIRRVIRTAELYAGPCLDDLPDLLVEWSDAVPTGSTQIAGGRAATVRARSPRIGTLEGANDYGRTGEHRPDGLFIAAGPGIRSARMERAVSILDFAPTFCRLLDVDLPDGDGRPLNELRHLSG